MSAYGKTLAWNAKTVRLQNEYRAIQGALKRMRFDRSPFIPRTFNEYLKYKADFAKDREVERCSHFAIRYCDIQATFNVPGHTDIFSEDEESFLFSRCRSLSLETIWSPLWRPTRGHHLASWPLFEELKEEGDERHTSGFGRYLPIPRVPGNSTVVWKQKGFIEPHQIDQVHPVARRYPIELPNDYEIIEPMEDEFGSVIDDPEESGKETTVEEFWEKYSSILQSDTKNYCLELSRELTENDKYHTNFNGRRRKSNLNPSAIDFAPSTFATATTKDFRQFQGIPTKGTQSMTFSRKSKSLSENRQSDNTMINSFNPFEALAQTHGSDESSQDSSQSSQYAVTETISNINGLGSDSDFRIPSFILYHTDSSSEIDHLLSNRTELEGEVDGPKDARAIDETMRGYFLPSLESLEQRINATRPTQASFLSGILDQLDRLMTQEEAKSDPEMLIDTTPVAGSVQYKGFLSDEPNWQKASARYQDFCGPDEPGHNTSSEGKSQKSSTTHLQVDGLKTTKASIEQRIYGCSVDSSFLDHKDPNFDPIVHRSPHTIYSFDWNNRTSSNPSLHPLYHQDYENQNDRYRRLRAEVLAAKSGSMHYINPGRHYPNPQANSVPTHEELLDQTKHHSSMIKQPTVSAGTFRGPQTVTLTGKNPLDVQTPVSILHTGETLQNQEALIADAKWSYLNSSSPTGIKLAGLERPPPAAPGGSHETRRLHLASRVNPWARRSSTPISGEAAVHSGRVDRNYRTAEPPPPPIGTKERMQSGGKSSHCDLTQPAQTILTDTNKDHNIMTKSGSGFHTLQYQMQRSAGRNKLRLVEEERYSSDDETAQ